MIVETVEVVESQYPSRGVICAPHRAAIEFLESDRDVRVLERQQPKCAKPRNSLSMLTTMVGESNNRL